MATTQPRQQTQPDDLLLQLARNFCKFLLDTAKNNSTVDGDDLVTTTEVNKIIASIDTLGVYGVKLFIQTHISPYDNDTRIAKCSESVGVCFRDEQKKLFIRFCDVMQSLMMT